MNRMEQTRALRADQAVHYNCCQSVLAPFAQEMGLTPEQAFRLGSHFGAGMRHGSTCGALAGALMVLGMTGGDEKQGAGGNALTPTTPATRAQTAAILQRYITQS